MRHLFRRSPSWLLVALVALLCLAPSAALSCFVPLPSSDEFNAARWELRHVPDKWLYLAGRQLYGRLSRDEEDARVAQFLLLTARVERLQALPTTDAPARDREVDELRDQRDEVENDVEAIIEGRLTAVIEDEGLNSSLPLFPRARWVWPPVDTEFGRTPPVLVVSPRDRIELIEQQPLAIDLRLPRAIELERAVERGGTRSALVDEIGGIATYPSDVEPVSDYQELISLVAHEWTHHYLTFKPLGVRYLSSLELQTMNETVADVSGQGLAELLVQRYPLSVDVQRQLDALALPEPPVDVGAVLGELRRQVDELLAAGEVEEAEALMERRRQELDKQGVHFRRINQAFFAFRNIYGTDPASVSPLGAELRELRTQSGSVGAFLRAASRLTSPADLERLLAGQR